MQAKNLDLLLADVRTSAFNATQNLASLQQTGPNSLFSMLFDQTIQMNRSNPANEFLSTPVQYTTLTPPDTDYIDTFRKDFMSSGIPMERFSLSSQARTDLQQIMTGQGHSESEVDNFLDTVFQNGSQETVKVSDFMKMYSEKKPLLEKNQNAPVVEASDVPTIEKGLKEYGLNVNQVKVAIENSRTETGDLDVKKLARELASISIPISNDRQLTDNTQIAMNQILSKLGVEISDKNAPLTFQQFVSVIQHITPLQPIARLSQEKMSSLLSKLMTNIRQTTQRQDALNIRQLYQSQLYQIPGFDLDLKDKPAIENALRNMGFSSDDIQKIMDRVLKGAHKISITNLIDALKTVKPELSANLSAEELFTKVQFEKISANLMSTDRVRPQLFDISKELKEILLKLGMSDNDVQTIISKSTALTGQIDLDQLVKNLKAFLANNNVKKNVELSGVDIQTIQNLMDRLKVSDKISVSALTQMDNKEIAEQLKKILTQLGLPKEDIQSLYTKAQGIQDSLSAQQLLSQISTMIEKSGGKLTDQHIKADLKTIENLLNKIQLSNQIISQSELADLKNMIKQFGATPEIINKIIASSSNKDLTLAQFATNLKKFVSQLDQQKKIALPEHSTIKNILANVAKETKQDVPKTLDAFVNQLETLSKKSIMMTNSSTKQLTIPSDYMNDLKHILAELGFKSGKIEEIIPKTTEAIPIQTLLAKIKPELNELSASSDKLKDGFAKLDRLLAFVQSKGTNEKAQVSMIAQKNIASTFTQLISSTNVHENAIIPSNQISLLEQALVNYGLNRKDARDLISQSKNTNLDISLAKLVENLRAPTENLSQNLQIKIFADHIDAYLSLLEKQSINDVTDKKRKIHQLFQKMRNGSAFDTKQQADQKSAKLMEAAQQSRMSKIMTQSQGTNPEAISTASTSDDNNAFISFLKQEAVSSQTAKTQTMPKTPERPVPYYLNHQIGRRLATAVRNNENQVTFQLRPPHLGNLQLNLEVQNNVLRIGMATDNQVTKDILISHVNELREVLADQGIKIDQVDIQINYDLGQSLAKDHRDVNEQRKNKQDGDNEQGDEENLALEDQEEIRKPIIYGDSSLSLIV